MARKRRIKQIDSEIKEQPDAMTEGKTVSKVAAVRAALAEGAEKPEAGLEFIRERFGIEISRQHFSAIKSRLKKHESGRAVVLARSTTAKGTRIELLTDLEAVKRLIAQHGADNVKRMVDLLG